MIRALPPLTSLLLLVACIETGVNPEPIEAEPTITGGEDDDAPENLPGDSSVLNMDVCSGTENLHSTFEDVSAVVSDSDDDYTTVRIDYRVDGSTDDSIVENLSGWVQFLTYKEDEEVLSFVQDYGSLPMETGHVVFAPSIAESLRAGDDLCLTSRILAIVQTSANKYCISSTTFTETSTRISGPFGDAQADIVDQGEYDVETWSLYEFNTTCF